MDALFAKGKEFLSSRDKDDDKETSNRSERTKHHDDVDDSDGRPERKASGKTAGGGGRSNDFSDGERPTSAGRGGRSDDGERPTGAGKTGGAHNPNEHQQPTTSELMASAKLIAATAQSQLGGGGEGKPKEELDTGKLAGAAADLLAAATHYGKLGDDGIGKYIGQAEDYLHGYELKNVKPNKASGGTNTGAGSKKSTFSNVERNARDDDDEHVRKEKRMPRELSEEGKGMPRKHSEEDDNHSRSRRGESEGMPKKKSGGHSHDEDDSRSGDYIQKAQGMLKKKSDDGDGRDGDSGGGMGGVMKMAQGMFKKDSGDRSPTKHSDEEDDNKTDYLKMAGSFFK